MRRRRRVKLKICFIICNQNVHIFLMYIVHTYVYNNVQTTSSKIHIIVVSINDNLSTNWPINQPGKPKSKGELTRMCQELTKPKHRSRTLVLYEAAFDMTAKHFPVAFLSLEQKFIHLPSDYKLTDWLTDWLTHLSALCS